jgi:hypothetical protein
MNAKQLLLPLTVAAGAAGAVAAILYTYHLLFTPPFVCGTVPPPTVAKVQ